MTIILCFTWFCFIVSCWAFKFNLATILAFVSTVMFSMRKVRYVSRLKHHVVIEFLGLFFTVVFQLLFSRFHMLQFIIYCSSRLLFLLVVWYDCKFWVYATEEVSSYEREN